MSNPTFIKNYVAEARVEYGRFVKFGAKDRHVTHAVAAGEGFGVVLSPKGADEHARVDAVRSGLANVEFGGAVARGGPVRAGADGKGVAATGTDRVLGYAEEEITAAGQIAPVMLSIG